MLELMTSVKTNLRSLALQKKKASDTMVSDAHIQKSFSLKLLGADASWRRLFAFLGSGQNHRVDDMNHAVLAFYVCLHDL